MSSIDEYFNSLEPRQRDELERIRRIVRETVPSVEEGVSYAMPAYMHQGRAFLSVMARKNFLSIYPFSGKVIDRLRPHLEGYELTSGSIHYSETCPVPEELLVEIIRCRLAEIEAQKPKRGDASRKRDPRAPDHRG